MSATGISFLVFVFIVCGYLALRGTGESKPEKLLQALPGAAVGSDYVDVLDDRVFDNRYSHLYNQHLKRRMKGPIPTWIITRLFGRSADTLKSRIMQAGLESKTSLDELLAIKVVCLIVAAISLVLFFVTVNPLFFALMAIGGYGAFLGVEFRLARMVKLRQGNLQKELPDYLTLLKAVMDTGVSIQRGIEIMVGKYPGLLSEEFHKAMVESHANGGNWRLALENMALRNDIEELSTVISDILLAYQRGTPVNDVLARQARDMREIYTTVVDEKAKALSVKLLIPLLIFSFGPLFLLIVAPLVMKFMTAFH